MFRDIVSVPGLADTHFHFMDIDKKNLDMVADVCQRQIDELNLSATIDKTLDRRETLTGADYVINCVRIGRLEAFETDVEIPLKYGVDQCVGDTLCIGGIMYGQRNVINNGCISNLPDDCIVEVPGYVDKNGMSIPKVGELPLACAATLNATVSVQRMAVYAGVTGDVELLKQAALHDPLTGAVCNPEEIWQMVDEMLVAGKKWLPQFASEMSSAKKRLAAAKQNGTYKGTQSTKGACRKKMKKVTAKKTAKKKTAKKKVAKTKVAKK